MHTRRTMLAGATTGAAALLAGCLEDLLGDDIEEEADPAEVDSGVVTAAEFEHVGTADYRIDEEFSLGDESIHLSALTWVASYRAESVDSFELADGTSMDDLDDLEPEDAAVVAVISTPSASFAGQEVNPAGRLEEDELIEEFNDELVDGHVDGVERVGTIDVEVLGEPAELAVFEATAHHDDVDDPAPVYLYLTTVESGDDYVLPAGVHHRSLDIEDRIVDMVEGVEHPVDPPD